VTAGHLVNRWDVSRRQYTGTLERRLVRLEAGAGIGVDFPVIFVSFGRPAATATVDGHTWHRASDEAEEAFLERVEPRRGTSGRVV
jgi:hypothetical protein